MKILPITEARTTLLKRRPINLTEVPAHVAASIANLFGEPLTPEQAVARILADVQTRGDAALTAWTKTLDDASITSFRVTQNTIQASLDQINVEERRALEASIARVRRFFTHQPMHSWIMQEGDGTLGQAIRPIARIGLYVPGGTAPLPSSLIMAAVPAQVAGVKEIAVVVPPVRGTQMIAPITLAAAALLGLDEIYTLGGAQAVAALAYGTASIPAVDKIFGPGNLFVTLAKRQVFGMVGIDGLPGPTETVVIADDSANPAWVAADMLAQAEHDVLASAILLTPSTKLAYAVAEIIEQHYPSLPRAAVMDKSLAEGSGIILTRDLAEAIEAANQYAPEHLCLALERPWDWVDQVQCAGGIFIGEYSCEVLGDYNAGPSHIMPTSGTARYASAINLMDFVKIISLVGLSQTAATELGVKAAIIARAEGLEAHAQAADWRAGKKE